MSAPTQAPTEQAAGPRPGEKGDPFRLGWRYVSQEVAPGRRALVQVPLTLEEPARTMRGREDPLAVTSSRRSAHLARG